MGGKGRTGKGRREGKGEEEREGKEVWEGMGPQFWGQVYAPVADMGFHRLCAEPTL